MNKCKGVGPLFCLKMAKDFGKETKFLSLLADEDKTALKTCLPISWMPIEFWSRCLCAAANAISGDTLTEIETGLNKIGKEMAKDNLRGIYAVLARILTIPYLIGQSSKLWAQYHDTGHAWTEQVSLNKAIFKVADYPDAPKIFLHYNTGYIYGLMEVTKALGVMIDLDETNPHLWQWAIRWKI
jgi:hypothetical protein